MNWNVTALSKECLETAGRLAETTCIDDFYLAGGTALALWFGHRISVDLDFFSDTNALEMIERQTIIAELAAKGMKIKDEKDGTLHVLDRQTHISFFRYRYPLLKPLSPWNGLRVADPLDIGLMKLGAVIGRGSKKDFYDMAALFSRGVALKQLLRTAKKKFSEHPDFDVQALRALVYFADAENEATPRLKNQPSWPEVKKIIETEVRQTADRDGFI